MSKAEMDVDVQPSGSSKMKNGPAAPARKSPAGKCASTVMAASGTQGSVSVAIHPLVIMNISEHWTRVRAQSQSAQQVFGAVIGKQKGRNLELMNSFELQIERVDGFIIVDKDFLRLREGQYKEVFSELDFLGWYTTGDAPTESDVAVHRQICEHNESAIMLKLNPQGNHQERLPANVYESVVDLVDGETKMLFIQLTYTLASEEAERIGVDHVARLSKMDTGENSCVSDHLSAQSGAIKMLHSRVKFVLAYLDSVQKGQLPKNDEILRDISGLCSRLPVANSDKFKKEFFDQCNDVSLVTYLGILTKMCTPLNQVINKYNVTYEKTGQGRRHKGMFF